MGYINRGKGGGREMKGQRTPTAERKGRQWQAGAVHTYMDIRAQTHIHTHALRRKRT